MADFHHPKLRLLKGDELTHQELDNNINSFYYSSSLDGSSLKLYAGGTSGSFFGYTQSYDVNAFTSSHAISASYAATASYAIIEVQKEIESINADTASYFAEGIITASSANNIITFTKDDSSTFNVTIDTGSLKAGLLSSSAQIATDISGSLSNSAISALNAGIVSASAQIRDRLVSAGAFTSASNASIRNTLGTNQFILSGSKPNANTLRLHPAAGTNLDYEVGGEDARLVELLKITGSILEETGSVKTRLNTLEAITGSILDATSSYYNSSSVALNTVKLFNGASTHTLLIDTGSGEPLPDGLLSSSAQIASDISGSFNLASGSLASRITSNDSDILQNAVNIAAINAKTLISSSALSNPGYGQGLIRHQVNADDPADAQVSNLSKTDSPVFNGITISGSTNFGSGSNSNNHLFTGSVYISGALHLGGGGAIGNDITGAFWQGYQISSSKIDFAAGAGNSLNDVLNKKFEKATFNNTSVELTLSNATGSTTLSTIDNRITGLLTESGSVKTRLNTIEAATSSYATKLDMNLVSGSGIINAALSGSTTNTIRFTQQDQSTIDLTIATSSVSIDGLLSSSAQIAEDISGSGNVRFEALNAATSSYLLNTTDTLTGNLTVTDTITATSASFEYLHSDIVSSSILLTTGSNIFGDQDSDTHTFTGSVYISGTLDLGGGFVRGNDITGAYWEGYVISASKVDIDVSGFVDTSGSPEDNDFAKFTDANTIEGRSYSQVKSDLSLEIGTDVLAQQTIGIADDNLLEVDDADAEDNDYAKFTANGLEGRSYAEVRSDLSLTKGISDGNILAANNAVADNDFLRVDGTEVEGRTATQVRSDLGLSTTDDVTFADIAGGWQGQVISASKVDIDVSGFVDTTGTVNANEFARFNDSNTLKALTAAEMKAALDLEIGTDVLAQQTIGIADNNLLEVDDADAADNDYAKFTANGLEGRSYAQVRSDINVEDGANNYSHPNHSGDVTSSAGDVTSNADGATTIANDKVTYAKMQNIPTANILGRVTAGTGNVEDLTATQVRTLINVADGATNVTNNNQLTNGAGYTTATGIVDTSGTPASQQIAIFTDANTISGSTNLKMHVNGSYPQFNGFQVGDGGTANLYLGNAIDPSSANKGARFHSNDNDFYFDFQGDATQNWYLRDYDGSGGTHTRFTFDFINSNFAAATATFSGNVTANNFVTTSDRELKDNIVPIKEGLETLKKFVSYEYELEGRKDAGFIAQEVEESLSYAVHKKQDGYLALDTKPILAHMHKAILEIDQRLSAIEDKLK